MLHQTCLWSHTVHPKKYAQDSCFVVFGCGRVLANFTHVLQGYFTGTGNHRIAPVPVKQPWRIWADATNKYSKAKWYNHSKTKSFSYITGNTLWWDNWMLLMLYLIEVYINGLLQERRNSSALAMELHLSCTNLLIWFNKTRVNISPGNDLSPL